MDKNKILGCLLGLAFGDALGAETEFLSIDGIYSRFPPNGPLAPEGHPARVTDDTQMALAVGEALLAAPRPYAAPELGRELVRTFMDWYNDPENNRAPGNTCLDAVEELIAGEHWIDASQISSKGCGANMRVMPVGLLKVDAPTRAAIAQLQAAITHGHPTALAASDLTAWVIADLGNGGTPEGLPERLRRYAESQRAVYHDDWLTDLWERVYIMRTPQDYITHGWTECLSTLDRLERALFRLDRTADPCLATGGGWVADEALATALLCFLMFPDDPVAVIRRAAVTSGDSDTIACIAGAFAGVYHGLSAWPPEWVERIEYRERLLGLGVALAEQHEQP